MLTIQGTLDAVVAASTANLAVTYNNGSLGVGATLTNTGPLAAFAVDGYTAVVGDRILIKDQTTQIQNGVYVVTVAGSVSVAWVLTRAADADNHLVGQVKPGIFVFVNAGTVNTNTSWLEAGTGTGISGVTIIGTDAIVFSLPNTVLYSFQPTNLVYLVNALFGIAKATVVQVNITQTVPNMTTVAYSVIYNNPTRGSTQVGSAEVFPDLNSAWIYYQTIIS